MDHRKQCRTDLSSLTCPFLRRLAVLGLLGSLRRCLLLASIDSLTVALVIFRYLVGLEATFDFLLLGLLEILEAVNLCRARVRFFEPRKKLR